MAPRVVWIDESNKEARVQRLRRAHIKARQKRVQAACSQTRREDRRRGYPVYQHGRRYRDGPRVRNLIDAALLIGGLLIFCMVMGRAGQ